MTEHSTSSILRAKLNALQNRGVIVLDPRQTYVDDFVDLDRIYPGVVLHPGTRLLGPRTFLGPGCQVGTQGPAVLEDTILGENAEVASGYLTHAVMLRNSRVGPNAHVRMGTLLEEGASTAHAVGLKQTILMSFVTLGSLINFCDGLISGGTSQRDHSEVGSGFIHFNFTPWGSGDKATPSLIGDVAQGALLRQPRIFLGGLSGMVGPQKVGFGSLTPAGQVIRSEVPPNRIFCEFPRAVDKELNKESLKPHEPMVERNRAYVGQLLALRAWYQEVRLARIPATPDFRHLQIVTEEAANLLSFSIDERIKRLREALEQRGRRSEWSFSQTIPSCPLRLEVTEAYTDHIEWLKSLSQCDAESAVSWLQSIADGVEVFTPGL